MSAEDRKAAEAKQRRWLSTMDGHTNGFVTCSCGSKRVDGKSHLDVTGRRVVGVTYTCVGCGHSTKVTARRGQLELETNYDETDLEKYRREERQ
jgi:hypothetical protein